MDTSPLVQQTRAIVDAVEKAILGKRDTIEAALAVLLASGHLLIEDIPGVGKTTLAKALARALGCEFKRIQFTPDLLPSDVTGTSVFNQKTSEFEFRPGPIFANIVLADEVNRSTPKTQSALLECMEERQVTVDGVTRPLPSPFFVIATQNNIELAGTYPLPEAQLDRFMARISIGYPAREFEKRILMNQLHGRPVDTIEPVVDAQEVSRIQAQVRDVYLDPSLHDFILDLAAATRTHPSIALGASPRASLALLYAAQARAAVRGREYVVPDDIKAMTVPVLGHRLIIRPEHRGRAVTPETCLADILARTAVPVAASRLATGSSAPSSRG